MEQSNERRQVNGTSQSTINKGEYYLIEGNLFINNNMYVNTNKNVFAYQGIGGTSSEANQENFPFSLIRI